MFKKLFLAGIVLLAASCSTESESTLSNENAMAPVKVHVSNFSMSVDDFQGGGAQTRATAVADYSNIKAVTLAFYTSDGTEQYKATQLKDDASTYTTFGSFSLSLPMGSYTMVVLAYDLKEGDVFALTNKTQAGYTAGSVHDTFAATQAVTISNTSAVDISATLDRVVSRLGVVSSDVRTANAASVRLTLSGGAKLFNPTTGLATTNTGFSNTATISAAVGSTTGTQAYMYLATDEQTMNVTIETLDADGNVLFSSVVNNVPFKRNRYTKLTGSMYSNPGVSGSFQVNTGWLDEYDMSF